MMSITVKTSSIRNFFARVYNSVSSLGKTFFHGFKVGINNNGINKYL